MDGRLISAGPVGPAFLAMTDSSRSSRSRRLPASPRSADLVTAVGFAVVVAAIFSGFPTAFGALVLSNVAQCVAPALAAVAGWRTARAAEMPSTRRGWGLLGTSAASWSLGQVIWTYYSISGSAAPFPSLADAGYLMAVPLALAGVWSLSTRSDRSTRVVSLVDGLIISGALISVSWPLVLGPSWRAGGDSVFTFALSLAYPVGDLAIASAVLMLVMRGGSRPSRTSISYLSLGLLLLSVADSVFVWSSVRGTEQSISVADGCWIGGYLAIMLAARHARAAQSSDDHEAPSLQRALVPFTLVTAAVGVRVGLVLTGHPGDGFLTAVTVATGMLVLARSLITMQENRVLTRSLEDKIGELTAREAQLVHQAFHDPLTELANRLLFGDRVNHAINRSRRTDDLTAVLFVDLDDFKTVNDSLGHAAGDRLLVMVGNRLSGCVRPGDTVARLGGDEFGILLEEMEDDQHPSRVSARIMEALEMPFPLDGREVFTRASIGMALASTTGETDGEHLLADADVALYAAKSAGKSTYRKFERGMRAAAVERLELGQDLRRAVQHDQFVCHYQPIVDLVTGRVVALEALVRWDHPERGLLPPAAFIAMAEDTGAISGLGLLVLEMAATQAVRWREDGSVPGSVELHVNMSGRQLQDRELVSEVRRILATTGLPPATLVLEITESVAVNVGARHLERLVELRDLGLRLAIDDFGSGYSSLNYLRTLPFDILKIDRAFAESDDGATDPVLLEAIVKLGRSLGIETIAEGIEREDQAATLRRLGCRRAQGYLFSPAVEAEAIPAFVAAARHPLPSRVAD